MLGALLPIPDPLTGPPKMLAHITMDEAQRLSDAAYTVAVEYDLAKYIGGKTPAIVALVVTGASIYLPKALMLKMMLAAKKAQSAAPQSAADMVNPQDQPKETKGAYTYQ